MGYAKTAIPDFLTHYYRNPMGPFLCLADLDPVARERILAGMKEEHTIGPWRFSDPLYMEECCRVNELVRARFIAKGGRPKRRNPHCAVLGTSSWIEEIAPGCRKVVIPLSKLDSDIVSFTYPDSGISFYFAIKTAEEARPYTHLRKPFHEQVFRIEELESLVAEYGLPRERWREDETYKYHYYIEAQIWDDESLRAFIENPSSED